MAKRINSVCERVTEIKNKRKKINSINKVINNELKKQDARTQNRTQKLHLAHSQSFNSKFDLPCNPTQTRWNYEHSIEYPHSNHQNEVLVTKRYLVVKPTATYVRLASGSNINHPVTRFMLVSKSSSPRSLPHWYRREVIWRTN